MNMYKLLIYDIRQGTLRFKRYIYLIIVCILQCLLVHMQLEDKISYAVASGIENCKYNFKDVLIAFFGGCDPFFKIEMGVFPYAWFSIYICVLFITYDYMHDDLTRYGIQVLSRSRSRIRWWLSKCLWNVFTVITSYLLIIFICVLFCVIAEISLAFDTNNEMNMLLSMQSSCYSAKEVFNHYTKDIVILFICPLIVMISISLFQMTLSLVIKPIFSFSIMIGFYIFSVFTDIAIAFPRTGMMLYNSIFYQDGFSSINGITICTIIASSSVIIGIFIFRKSDILPDKEEK